MEILKTLKDNLSLSNIKGQVSTIKNTAKLIESLLSLLQDNKISASSREMLNNLKVVLIDKPNIVSINHFINHFVLKLNPENQPIVLKEILEVFHERWKNVERKTALIAYNLYDFKNKRILFYGASDYMEALIDICLVNEANIKVVQIVDNFDNNTKEQAKLIQSKGIDVTVTNLQNIGRLKEEIQYIIVTSDIIMQNKFIVKSGMNLIAPWAKENQIPILVCSDTRKILNTKILPPSVLGSFINETSKSSSEIWKSSPSKIQIINYHLEEIENKWVNSFVFEQHAYCPEELSLEVDKILVSKFI
ncbi:MAG: hypothetical protein LC105_10775 [Chitinophagales bacterium]|nr:hypothetical protein [Chitinophagales bacterium]